MFDARTNAFLARWRVPLGFAFGVVVFWLAAPTRTTLASGAAIAGLGEGIRMWAAGHLRKSREVTSSGPYRWTAHPLYAGSSVIGVGLAVACASLPVAILIAAYLAVALPAAARHEGAYLRETFGDRYDRYRSGSATPGEEAVGSPIEDEPRRFSFARAMKNREYRAVVGLLLAVLLLALKARANV